MSNLSTHIALLRGINVGGHHKLPMKQLVTIFETVGCRDVRTYIQSGNVVFAAEPGLAHQIPQLIPAAIVAQFGFEPPVITRTAHDLAQLVEHNPYQQVASDDKMLHVAFLAEAPEASEIARLDPQRSPPDQFTVRGREIFLYCPNGLARTKLTNAWLDSRLATVSTMRNWRTTLTLLAMASTG